MFFVGYLQVVIFISFYIAPVNWFISMHNRSLLDQFYMLVYAKCFDHGKYILK